MNYGTSIIARLILKVRPFYGELAEPVPAPKRGSSRPNLFYSEPVESVPAIVVFLSFVVQR